MLVDASLLQIFFSYNVKQMCFSYFSTKMCIEGSQLWGASNEYHNINTFWLNKITYHTFTRKYSYFAYVILTWLSSPVECKMCDNGHVGDTAFLPRQKKHITPFGALGSLAFDSAYDIK